MAFSVDSPHGARAIWLDLFKTLLVYGMIGAHVIQLLGFDAPPTARMVSDFANLITFSGFMLAFGLGLGLSRKEHSDIPLPARLRPALLLLAATYASSLGYVLLVERLPLTRNLATDLLTMRRLFGWSEFLASFAMLYVLIGLARPWLIKIGRNGWTLLAATALCLSASFIRVSFDLPLIATLVGTTNFPSFPLLPYLPWLFVGIHLAARMPPRRRAWTLALAATAAFYGFIYVTGEVPERFPPDALWVVAPALFLMGYLVVAHGLARSVHLPDFLLLPGRHVLSFLLFSNLAIFLARYAYGRPVQDHLAIAATTAAIIFGLSLLWSGAQAMRRRWLLWQLQQGHKAAETGE